MCRKLVQVVAQCHNLSRIGPSVSGRNHYRECVETHEHAGGRVQRVMSFANRVETLRRSRLPERWLSLFSLSKRQIPPMKRALSMIVSTLCLAIATVFGQLHENIGPGGNEDETITTKAPSGQYSLIQTQALGSNETISMVKTDESNTDSKSK